MIDAKIRARLSRHSAVRRLAAGESLSTHPDYLPTGIAPRIGHALKVLSTHPEVGSTVQGLSRAILHNGDHSVLPILSDALQDDGSGFADEASRWFDWQHAPRAIEIDKSLETEIGRHRVRQINPATGRRENRPLSPGWVLADWKEKTRGRVPLRRTVEIVRARVPDANRDDVVHSVLRLTTNHNHYQPAHGDLIQFAQNNPNHFNVGNVIAGHPGALTEAEFASPNNATWALPLSDHHKAIDKANATMLGVPDGDNAHQYPDTRTGKRRRMSRLRDMLRRMALPRATGTYNVAPADLPRSGDSLPSATRVGRDPKTPPVKALPIARRVTKTESVQVPYHVTFRHKNGGTGAKVVFSSHGPEAVRVAVKLAGHEPTRVREATGEDVANHPGAGELGKTRFAMGDQNMDGRRAYKVYYVPAGKTKSLRHANVWTKNGPDAAKRHVEGQGHTVLHVATEMVGDDVPARESRGDMHSWLKPSGEFVEAQPSHYDAIIRHGFTGPEAAFAQGWHRVTHVGPYLIAHNPHAAPNHRQKSALVDLAIENRMGSLVHDDDETERTLWDEKDQLSREDAEGETPERESAYRAPAGGIITRGIYYKGGSLIPDLARFARAFGSDEEGGGAEEDTPPPQPRGLSGDSAGMLGAVSAGRPDLHPILADALEEGDNAHDQETLDHLRNDQSPVPLHIEEVRPGRIKARPADFDLVNLMSAHRKFDRYVKSIGGVPEHEAMGSWFSYDFDDDKKHPETGEPMVRFREDSGHHKSVPASDAPHRLSNWIGTYLDQDFYRIPSLSPEEEEKLNSLRSDIESADVRFPPDDFYDDVDGEEPERASRFSRAFGKPALVVDFAPERKAMSDHTAFIRAISATNDDLPSLVHADWLEEQGVSPHLTSLIRRSMENRGPEIESVIGGHGKLTFEHPDMERMTIEYRPVRFAGGDLGVSFGPLRSGATPLSKPFSVPGRELIDGLRESAARHQMTRYSNVSDRYDEGEAADRNLDKALSENKPVSRFSRAFAPERMDHDEDGDWYDETPLEHDDAPSFTLKTAHGEPVHVTATREDLDGVSHYRFTGKMRGVPDFPIGHLHVRTGPKVQYRSMLPKNVANQGIHEAMKEHADRIARRHGAEPEREDRADQEAGFEMAFAGGPERLARESKLGDDATAFLKSIAANPEDGIGPLAFADWLDEHNNHGMASVIRNHAEDGDDQSASPTVFGGYSGLGDEDHYHPSVRVIDTNTGPLTQLSFTAPDSRGGKSRPASGTYADHHWYANLEGDDLKSALGNMAENGVGGADRHLERLFGKVPLDPHDFEPPEGYPDDDHHLDPLPLPDRVERRGHELDELEPPERFSKAFGPERLSASSNTHGLLHAASRKPYDTMPHLVLADSIEEDGHDSVAGLIRAAVDPENFAPGYDADEGGGNTWYNPINDRHDTAWGVPVGTEGPFDLKLHHEGWPGQSQRWVLFAKSNHPKSRGFGYAFEFDHDAAKNLPEMFPDTTIKDHITGADDDWERFKETERRHEESQDDGPERESLDSQESSWDRIAHTHADDNFATAFGGKL